jgi:hypothetical protein
MFRRLLWLGIGIGIGVAVVRMLSKKASAFSPAGLAGQATESISGVTGSVREFIDDFREAMHEREEDIRQHFAEGIALDTPDLPWAQGVGDKFEKFKRELEDDYGQ